MITCQSFFMVNALIERTTAGSDYQIIIISFYHHIIERERGRGKEKMSGCCLCRFFPQLSCCSLLLFIQENDKIQTRPIAANEQSGICLTREKRFVSSIQQPELCTKVNIERFSYCFVQKTRISLGHIPCEFEIFRKRRILFPMMMMKTFSHSCRSLLITHSRVCMSS